MDKKYYIKLMKLHKKFMKTLDTFWYSRYKNLRDALKSIIYRNKLFEGIFSY